MRTSLHMNNKYNQTALCTHRQTVYTGTFNDMKKSPIILQIVNSPLAEKETIADQSELEKLWVA